MKRSLPIILIAFMALLIFFAPSYGWKIRSFFARHNNVMENSSSSLALENEALKAEVAKLQKVASQLPEKPLAYARAMVYSRYPFNFKNELLINIGKNDGITLGRAVVFGGVLVGRIEKVFEDTALVQTIFDSRFQMPVRVGSSGVEALFKGGSLPVLALVPLKAAIQKEDIVYSASPDFPYGLPIAEIGEAKVAEDQLFQEASLNFTYDINGIETVFVLQK